MREGIKVSEEQAVQIEVQTRAQATSTQWQKERKVRLTASHFGEICKMTEDRDIEKLCKSMHNPPNLIQKPAIRHGCTYEDVALKKFSEMTGKKVLKSGLCVHPDYPFLGASPDAFVEGEEAVCEVKCPYNGRKKKISPGKDFSFLEEVDGEIHLKKNHNYYYQVIGQLKLSKRSFCYFIVYTFEDIFVEKIAMDEEFFKSNMLLKLLDFYDIHYCPYLAEILKK